MKRKSELKPNKAFPRNPRRQTRFCARTRVLYEGKYRRGGKEIIVSTDRQANKQ